MTKWHAAAFMPTSEKREIAAPSRQLAESLLPTAWLDRLLTTVLAVSRHRKGNLDDRFRPLLALTTELLGDDVTVAVCLPGATGDHSNTPRFPFVISCGPLAVGTPTMMSLRSDSAPLPRLFPGETHEAVFHLEDDSEDSTASTTPTTSTDYAGATFHVTPGHSFVLAPGSVGAMFLDRVHEALMAQVARVQDERQRARQTVELQRLHERAHQSEKLVSLGQLVAGVVHEINNPLGSIIAYTDYLIRKAESNSSAIEAEDEDTQRLYRIRTATEQILRFSRELTAYARPSSGLTEAISLYDVIHQALVFCEHTLRRTGVDVDCNVARDLPPVDGINSELIQVFVNLVTNACHAMRESGGHIFIRAETDQTYVRVSVGDDGHGIEERHLHQIFEPFFTTKSEEQGTGLGLSIVHNIVRRHGGTIRAESRAGHGAEFTITLSVVPR